MAFDVEGVRQSLNAFSEMLTESGTAIDGNFHKSLAFRTSEESSLTVTWATAESVTRPLTGLKTGSLAEYLWFLRNRQYTALLFDGSLVQMSYEFRRSGALAGHRLAYFPSPVALEKDETLTEAVEDLIELYLSGTDLGKESETGRFMLRPYLRFDFSIGEGEGKPKSHAHFAYDKCRVPVRTPVSPWQFAQFIFANFYSEQWNAETFNCCIKEHLTEVLAADHVSDLHFSWRASA